VEELISNYKEKIKENVYVVEDFKGNLLVAKIFPKTENRYTSIYLHEIETLKKLQHKNIIQIKNNGEYKDEYYILFEYIDGENFVDKFQNLSHPSIQCSFFKVAIKILETLDYIHSHNFIHKDIKPNNILVKYNYEPYILDFGTTAISNTLTKTQQELTLWYASPEQKNNQDIDETTDLYSFGITLIETIVDKEKFELFTRQKIDLDELINNVILFKDGRDEELRNILKRLTYQEQNRRYQRVKNVINDIKNISSFLNCYNKYELNISDNVKNKIQEDYSLSPWDILKFIQEKLDKEIKYIQYGKDRQNREEIKIATSELFFKCGIRNEKNFYVYSYSKRVPESVKRDGHIIDDNFIVTDGIPNGEYSSTYELIDKLQRLEEKNTKKKQEHKAKRSFLEKAETQLKVERTILDKKDITLFGQNFKHKRAKKELIIKIVNLSNVKITMEHLKDKNQNEKFVQDLFSDDFIDNPNNENIDEYLLEMLNGLIKSYFFERNKKEIAKKLFKNLSKRQHKINEKYIENLLIKKYSNHSPSQITNSLRAITEF
jgi:serine/threonine protein kinase